MQLTGSWTFHEQECKNHQVLVERSAIMLVCLQLPSTHTAFEERDIDAIPLEGDCGDFMYTVLDLCM